MAMYFFTNDDIPNCHTASCIGGWAISLSRNETPSQAEFSTRGSWSTKDDARQALGLTQKQADKLFYATPEAWGKFADRYNNADNPTLAAQVAAERIDHFIATGGLE